MVMPNRSCYADYPLTPLRSLKKKMVILANPEKTTIAFN